MTLAAMFVGSLFLQLLLAIPFAIWSIAQAVYKNRYQPLCGE